MIDFSKLLSEQMKDPEFRKEYEALEPEFTIKRAMIDARKAKGTIVQNVGFRKVGIGNPTPIVQNVRFHSTKSCFS